MASPAGVIEREALARYLAGVFHARVEILALQPLKAAADGDADPKGFGYGVPFEVERVVGGAPRSLVVSRTKLGLRKHALGDAATVAEPFLSLFRRFLDTYLTASGDAELLEVLPPFFAFRALVIAHPRWYPALSADTRVALIRFARTMLDPAPFNPETLPAMFGVSR